MTALAVTRAKEPGRYPDGGGLYLQVTPQGARSWTFRFERGGRERQMGLGPLHTITLADARTRAAACRKLLLDGLDPIEARKAQQTEAALEAARSVTFAACVEQYIEAHRAGWRNAKHADQWTATLKTYAEPIIGKLAVQAVDVGLVTRILEPIWSTKTETASRLRGRIEAVLDWATSRGLRKGENPARWRGHLDNLLPKRSKVRKVEHHAALPYVEMGAFMAELRAQDGTAARALEFLILTATRTGETIGARWDELAGDGKLWTVPPERIKTGREHRVPLSAPAAAIVKRQREGTGGHFVFAGGRRGKPLSNMALLALLKRMGRSDLTAHGFRSTFRDWAAERTNYPRDVAEMALAHAVGDKVEAAYRRGDLFEKRRRLMEEWARFCGIVQAAGKLAAIGGT
jgi:integrase